jgi:hypothetical protein
VKAALWEDSTRRKSCSNQYSWKGSGSLIHIYPNKPMNRLTKELIEESYTKTLAEINFEKHQLMRNGIPVDYVNEKGEQIKNKTTQSFRF